MVRKGLSAEEKRERILAIYHSAKSIFNLKEIEKAASKQGVVTQTVKVRFKARTVQWLMLKHRKQVGRTLCTCVHVVNKDCNSMLTSKHSCKQAMPCDG